MDRSDVDEMKRLTSDSTSRQVAVLMGDPEVVEHPAEAILGVYEDPPQAFEKIANKDIPGTVLVTTFHREVCRWEYDPVSDKWDTGCGTAHQFMTDGVKENLHHFCPYCGGKIQEVADEN